MLQAIRATEATEQKEEVALLIKEHPLILDCLT
jgi:hypothetical protein